MPTVARRSNASVTVRDTHACMKEFPVLRAVNVTSGGVNVAAKYADISTLLSVLCRVTMEEK